MHDTCTLIFQHMGLTGSQTRQLSGRYRGTIRARAPDQRLLANGIEAHSRFQARRWGCESSGETPIDCTCRWSAGSRLKLSVRLALCTGRPGIEKLLRHELASFFHISRCWSEIVPPLRCPVNLVVRLTKTSTNTHFTVALAVRHRPLGVLCGIDIMVDIHS